MNRRDVSNVVVSMAGVLAQTNAEADAEIAQLTVAVRQRDPVVSAAKKLREEVHRFATSNKPAEGSTMPVSISLLEELFAALKGCP